MSDVKQRILVVYSRKDCCLCHEMLDALKPWENRYNFKVEMIDIDHNPGLTERFAARIPLLAEGDTEICQYHIDEQMLLNHFKGIG
ncbi:MAG: hypothetical protein DHS20C09_17490 [marine bacterium B5-7]|nr:MAG: hypothetical protein DHS20C09_17490 [marine bacterium B5-7]